MMGLGPTELIIILIIVLLLFGVGRVSRIGSELGSAVSNFRRGVDAAKTQDEANEPTNLNSRQQKSVEQL